MMGDSKITIPKLSGANWQSWKVRVEALLTRDDLWDVVNNPLPEERNRDNVWRADDRRAKATLVLLLEDNQLSLVKNCAYAHDVFCALKSYHEKSTRSVRVSLLKKLCSANLSEGGDVEKHLQEMDEVFDRLDAVDTKLDKDVKICMLLRSLSPSFDSLVLALDSRSDDDLSLDVVKSKVVDEYQRRLERDGATGKGEKAMRSSENKFGKGVLKCYYCKKAGHLERNCRLKQSQVREENSPRSGGRENGSAKAKAADTDVNGLAFTMGSERKGTWLIDSGASAHMTHDRSFFSSLNECASGWITLADGKKTQILGVGSGVLYGIDGEEKVVKIDVKEVKYVPGLATNLISVACLAQKGLKVKFDEKCCRIEDSKKTVVATGVRCGGLYHLRIGESSMQASSGHHLENCQHQWHRRLGHRDWAAVERINKERLATGLKVVDCGMKLVCECCLEGKSARLPFPPVQERKSTQVLDIVHTDLCGPMNNTTPSGNRYVMNIVDDYSRFTVTYLLKNKSEAADNIKDYVRWTRNLFGRNVRVVRSDGGGEFDNRDLRNFYKLEGIKPQYTTPYSPQQNGVAERKNRSLTEMATCMLIDAKLPKIYWGEAILTATYLQNRLPSRAIQKTPYEIWWGRKPELGHLRVFGSEAFVHIPDAKRSKLDSKAVKLRFVGYCMENKGYRFLNPETKIVVVSRDARFVELGNGTSGVEFMFSKPKTDEKELVKEEFEIPVEKPVQIQTEHDNCSEYEDANSDEADEPDQTIRKSSRRNIGEAPKYLEDYDLDAAGIAAFAHEEPANFKEAVEMKQWRDAMEDELASHHRNETWEVVPLPHGRKVVGSRWVYKVKRDENNKIVKFKARVVAQGYSQRLGEDFSEVFAPVARHATLRLLFTIASNQQLKMRQLDVKTAYLNGSLDEEVFMRPPPGYTKDGQEQMVCRLKKSIYGLRQSARCWNKRLDEVLLGYGFKSSAADPCLYVKITGSTKLFLLVYVDDLLIAAKSESDIDSCFAYLIKKFEITSLGQPRHFLGMEVAFDKGVYKVRLRNHIDGLLDRNGMIEAKTAKSPMDPGYPKREDCGKVLEDPTEYRSLVGGLLYLAVLARPDIAACTAILGRKFSEPRDADLTAAKQVLRFLKGTKDLYLKLGGMPDAPLSGYSDADWAGDPESRRSTTGFIFSYGGGTIAWASRRQSSVTLSSMEAEYVALSEATQEAVWLRQLLGDIGERQKTPTVIKEDNQGCLAFVKSERSSRRSKHIDTRERFVQELCVKKEIALEYCPTDLMLADVFTKPLGPQKHNQFQEMLGLKE